MTSEPTIKINFRGGIISPGDLYNILVAATRSNIHYVSFGLRQQLIVKTAIETVESFENSLCELGILYERETDFFPNITSSYPAEEVFINNTWLSEGVYKDIFDGIDYQPKLKINISDSNQSFTPMLTGNINWVASGDALHFWHLFIRFPKTNTIFEWNQLVYTNDVPRISKRIEELIFSDKEKYVGNNAASGPELLNQIDASAYITRNSGKPATLPSFNLPYYEGLNRYNNKYWLGVYRRDELFSVDFLKELCLVCLDTKIGQLCSTPWKTIIIKGIEEKDRTRWNKLLEKYQINMRHAANELNFQVEDDCEEGLALKNFLVKQLNNDDTRTFGICIGIKTRRKSEVFSSILVRRKSLFRLFGKGYFNVYDILCARDYNPNERTGFTFSKNNPKFLLPEQLRRSIYHFYEYRASLVRLPEKKIPVKKEIPVRTTVAYVHQCVNCMSIYESATGDPDKNIPAGTLFDQLPADYCCAMCESEKSSFKKIMKSALGLQAI